MADNQFLPFAFTDTGSNLMSQAAYEKDTERFVGNQPGVARSDLVNKVLRQTSLVAAGVGEFLAEHATEGDPDVSDGLTPAELAGYLKRTISGMAGSGSGGGMPEGGEPGQALVMGINGPEWQFVSGVPLGQLTFLPYDEAPPGFVKISTTKETVISLEVFPQALKMACPAGFNDQADFFYRASYGDGTVRHPEGPYLVLPAASKYFFRGFDEDGGLGPYRYQQDAMQQVKGQISLNNNDGSAQFLTDVPTANLNQTGPLFITSFQNKSTIANGGNTKSLPAGIGFDLSRSARTADETRPMNIGVFRVFIKLWDAVEVPAEVDVQALLAEMRALSGSMHAVMQGQFKKLRGSADGIKAELHYAADAIILGNEGHSRLAVSGLDAVIDLSANGLNALDAGNLTPDCWHFVYAVGNVSGDTGFVASRSSVAPVLPVGMTHWARIGSFFTDPQGVPYAFLQAGNRTQYILGRGNMAQHRIMASGTTSGSAYRALPVDDFVPTTAQEICLTLSGHYNDQFAAVAPSLAYSHANNAMSPPMRHSTQVNGSRLELTTSTSFLLESRDIYWIATGSSWLACTGYIDTF